MPVSTKIPPPAPPIPDLPRIYVGTEILDLPQPEWLVEGLVQAKGLTVIHGDPGSGKSLLAQDWAMCIQNGWSWYGRESERGNVLYLMAEGQGGLAGRVMAWMQNRNADVVPEVRWMLDPPDLWKPPGAKGSKELAACERFVSEDEVSLVVVDTLSATFGGGNENMQQDMNQFVESCQAFQNAGAAVVVVHHNAKTTGEVRGSTVLKGAADCMILTDPVFTGPLLDHTTIICGKRKDGVPFSNIKMNAIEYAVDTTFGTSLVLTPDWTATQSAAESAFQKDEALVVMLRALLEEGLGNTEWMRKARLTSQGAFDRRRKWLIRHGYVEQLEERGPYSLTDSGVLITEWGGLEDL